MRNVIHRKRTCISEQQKEATRGVSTEPGTAPSDETPSSLPAAILFILHDLDRHLTAIQSSCRAEEG